VLSWPRPLLGSFLWCRTPSSQYRVLSSLQELPQGPRGPSGEEPLGDPYCRLPPAQLTTLADPTTQKALRERKDAFKADNNVTLLNVSAVDATLLDTCALVGNSGVLIARPLGPLIDAHHAVMRLNQVGTLLNSMFCHQSCWAAFCGAGQLLLVPDPQQPPQLPRGPNQLRSQEL
jgi:hypothetical protein